MAQNGKEENIPNTLGRARKHPDFKPKDLLTSSEVEALLKDAKAAQQKYREILGQN